jgi:hypothetical protein
MSPYLYIYSQTRCRNETKKQRKILLRMCTLFYTSFFTHCLRSSIQHRQCWTFFFEPVGVEVFRLCFKLFLRHMWNEILWDVFWELQITRNQTVPNPGCREDVEQFQVWCSLSPLKWQHQYGVRNCRVEESSVFSRRTRFISFFSLFAFFTLV